MIELSGFEELAWHDDPVRHEVRGPDEFLMSAGPRTDLFCDPGGDAPALNAPMLLGRVQGDHALQATVSADLVSTFDAGALVLFAGPSRWAKLALELSPQARPTIVSVVTDGRSDDANAMELDSPAIDLRIAPIGDAHAFHVRRDGQRWELVRHFALAPPLRIGFLAQSPVGEGLEVRFSAITVQRLRLSDLRDGS